MKQGWVFSFGVVLAAVVALSPGVAHGWGMSAHAYVASKACKGSNLQAAFTATLPDMFGFGSTSAISNCVQHMTHHEYELLEPSFSMAGLVTHNGTWGADWYAHCYYSGIETTYLTSRMRILATEYDLTMVDAESVIEGTVDYILRKNLGAEWGSYLVKAADTFGASEREELVRAFAGPLAARTGISQTQAENEIRRMADLWKAAMKTYANGLATRTLENVRLILVDGMRMTLGVDSVTADVYVTRAEALCVDVQDELDDISFIVADGLQETSFALPAVDRIWGGMALGMLVGVTGCWVLARGKWRKI